MRWWAFVGVGCCCSRDFGVCIGRVSCFIEAHCFAYVFFHAQLASSPAPPPPPCVGCWVCVGLLCCCGVCLVMLWWLGICVWDGVVFHATVYTGCLVSIGSVVCGDGGRGWEVWVDVCVDVRWAGGCLCRADGVGSELWWYCSVWV